MPVYTIVIALYREARIAQQLSQAIDSLNYPRAKLDVIFVVEIDDHDTAAALHAAAPQTPYEIVIAPKGAPRTKPRALNVAMPLARGALVAVFDAEDVPQPEQLRRAAALFATLPPEIACLQASLVIDNARQNWMTALFAMDYAALCDVYNRGLSTLALPIFLGGTSNHFRIEPLREIGFWDAFNVTEDADLGLRLARAGYDVRTFGSDTYEEAPGDFVALARQRTRWLKGWMQTALPHCRHPLRLIADLGPRRAGAVMAMFFGGVLGPLLGAFLRGALSIRRALWRIAATDERQRHSSGVAVVRRGGAWRGFSYLAAMVGHPAQKAWFALAQACVAATMARYADLCGMARRVRIMATTVSLGENRTWF